MADVKKIPILFTTEMVNAILREENPKTQTRRIVKFPKEFDGRDIFDNYPYGYKYTQSDGTVWREFPKWMKNDIIWVKETWCYAYDNNVQDGAENRYSVIYKASENGRLFQENCEGWRWRSPLFMPKGLCRLKLLVTDVCIQKLHDITEADAIAEGIEKKTGTSPIRWFKQYNTAKNGEELYCTNPIFAYQTLWEKINGKDSWQENPYIWKINFKKIEI